MTDTLGRAPGSKSNVYFIDDSATMREVVKIAFRRENFNVVTCSDMASAVAQFEQTPPDAVISDVIMPDKDGYQLCQYVKQHPLFGGTPVFLMSGVVNKEVAERAHEVKADELIRKPFHPQDLVARVKKLLDRSEPEQTPAQKYDAGQPNPLTQLFERSANLFPQTSSAPRPTPAATHAIPQATLTAAPPAVAKPASPASSQEVLRLRAEIRRLESLIKKLQSDLASEREYSASLESQLRTLSTAE
jgi:DNA-binding response OmpR family regulator